MRIQKLELKNFRGFEELEINFPEGEGGLAVFVGVNGSGKSSLLDAIDNLLCANLYSLYDTHQTIFNKAKNSSLFSALNKGNSAIKNTDIKEGKKYLYSALSFSIGNDKIKNSINFKGENSFEYGDDSGMIEINKEKEGSFHINSDIITKLIANNPLYIKYSADRSIPKKPNLKVIDLNSLRAINSRYINDLDHNLSLKEFFQWFRSIEDIENEEMRFNGKNDFRDKSLETVRRAIKTFLPNFNNFRVKRQPEEVFVLEKNNTLLSFSNLSHGERMVITMVGDIARLVSTMHKELENPLEGKAIVLIDEIEQHLHPSWQRTIIPNLRKTFPNVQFIITTHSPQVLSNVQRENVFMLEDFKLIKSTPHTYGRDSNSILWELFGVSERPDHTKNEFSKLYRMMDDPSKDEDTKMLLNDLEVKYGKSDNAVMQAKLHYEFMTR